MGAGKITVDLEARSDKWSAGIGRAEKDVRKFVDMAEGGLKSLAGMKGAGAFADVFAKGTKVASELATELRTGASYADALGHVVDRIPIVGTFRQAGAAIRELVTGEKAAAVELEKQIAGVNRLADGYRAMAFAEAGLGKRGYELELVQADARANAEQTRIKNEKEQLQKQYRALEMEVRQSGGFSTPAQRNEAERLRKENEMLSRESVQATRSAEWEKLKIRIENQDAFAEDRRRSENDLEEVIAGMEERSLRRQGKGIESAIKRNVEATRVAVSDLRASIRDNELAKLAPEDRATKVADVERKIAALERAMIDVNAENRFEGDRKQLEQAKDAQEKLHEIAASGNIERLRLEDERINAGAEKRGQANRSHLAEAAQVEEEFRKQTQEILKKNREDSHKNQANLDDPTLKASIQAAREERAQKLALLNETAESETLKNQQSLAKEARQMWEEAGTPLEKYIAKLADVEDHYAKFHDAALRTREMGKLDQESFSELRRLNPDHEPNVNLYGRTGSYAGLKVGEGSGVELARQQLELAKKTAQQQTIWTKWFFDIWTAARKLGLPIPQPDRI